MGDEFDVSSILRGKARSEVCDGHLLTSITSVAFGELLFYPYIICFHDRFIHCSFSQIILSLDSVCFEYSEYFRGVYIPQPSQCTECKRINFLNSTESENHDKDYYDGSKQTYSSPI